MWVMISYTELDEERGQVKPNSLSEFREKSNVRKNLDTTRGQVTKVESVFVALLKRFPVSRNTNTKRPTP